MFRRNRAHIDKVGRRKAKKKSVTRYMEALYSLEYVGSTYFYEQDEDGFPMEKTNKNIVGEEPFKRTLLVRDNLNSAAWGGIKKLENFEGGAWQPWT